MTYPRIFAMAALGLLSSLAQAQRIGQRSVQWQGFEQASTTQTGLEMLSISSADLNADGYPDLISGGRQGLHVILSQGAAGFATPTTYAASQILVFRKVLAADFDQDGDIDLAWMQFGSPPPTLSDHINIRILSNNGNGTFVDGGNFPVLQYPTNSTFFIASDWITADLNADGAPDFAVATTNGSLAGGIGLFSVAINNTPPGGAFSIANTIDIPTGKSTSSFIESGDLDSDGTIDLIISQAPSNSYSILFNDGSGVSGNVDSKSLSGKNVTGDRPLALVDCNLDGYLDILYLLPGQYLPNFNNIRVLLNLKGGSKPKNAGKFKQVALLPAGPQPPIAISTEVLGGDFDLDGLPDMAISYSGIFGNIEITPNVGRPRTQSRGFSHFDSIAVDLDLDGDLDLVSVSASNSYSISINRGRNIGFGPIQNR